MGTAEGQSYLENKPKEMPVILDDPKKQAVQLLPVGLGNLGNTCYLNSSLLTSNFMTYQESKPKS